MTDKQPDALAKKLAKALEFDDFISVKLLRQAATLLRTQHKKIAAYELLTKSQEAQLSHHREQSDKYREAIATLQSERDANALLTAAIERKDALLRKCLKHVASNISMTSDGTEAEELYDAIKEELQ